ncbi:MAG: hypothetical protein GXO66_06285 [Euryarchaeota archaeon]|nr:hypothetical protein [Euryarchaeota archaeon]
MVKASAYTLEEVAERLDEAFGMFIDGDEEYASVIREVKERLEKLSEKYPDDGELREYLQAFQDFYSKREEGKLTRDEEKERLVWLKSEINHIVHWRKLGMSAGRVLPFKDFRSMRGEIGRRGI